MENFKIEPSKNNLAIAGETASGNFSTGICNLYNVESETGKWKIEIGHTIWENGEEEIAAKNVSPDSLTMVKNRMRMIISKCEQAEFPDSKFVTMRMAFLKSEGMNNWSNLRNASMGELSELVGGNVLSYFKKVGAKTVDYKIDVFNQTGTSANQLVVIYPNENIEVPVRAFIVTRVIPLVTEIESQKNN